jgi:hypothetical protein
MNAYILLFIGGMGLGSAAVVLIQWYCVIRPLLRRLEEEEKTQP